MVTIVPQQPHSLKTPKPKFKVQIDRQTDITEKHLTENSVSGTIQGKITSVVAATT